MFPYFKDSTWPAPVRSEMEEMFTINELSEFEKLADKMNEELLKIEYDEIKIASETLVDKMNKE